MWWAIPLQHFGVSDDIHFDKLTRYIIIANCGHLSVFLPLFYFSDMIYRIYKN